MKRARFGPVVPLARPAESVAVGTAGAVAPVPAPAADASVWVALSAAVARHVEETVGRERMRRQLRTRVDVVVDPEGLQNAEWGERAQCEGDDRLRRVQVMLDSFGVERHDTQKLWHWHMLAACLPHVYGRDWPRACHRVLKSLGLRELRSEVLIQTFRRAGKTW